MGGGTVVGGGSGGSTGGHDNNADDADATERSLSAAKSDLATERVRILSRKVLALAGSAFS
jgi:hypothetical protein